MAIPKGYTNLRAHEDSIAKARETKNRLGLTWNEFFELAADELTGA